MLYKVVVVFSPCRRTGLDVGAIPPRQSIVVCASATDISRLGLSLGVDDNESIMLFTYRIKV